MDSSVAVKWVNSQGEKFLRQADTILKHMQNGEISITMPDLAKYEVGNALLNKEMSLTATQTSLGTIYEIPIQFVSQDKAMAQTTLKIAKDSGMTYYDASFIALAKRLKADLVTDNPKHQNKYRGKEIKIISLQYYK